MAHSLACGTWYRRLGVCAAIAVAAGCNGSDSLSGAGGAGGSKGATGLGAHSGGAQGTGASDETSGTGATGGGGPTGEAGVSGEAGVTGGGSGGGTGGSSVGGSFGGTLNTEVDILVMIDNSSEMSEMQEKLNAQLPSFLQTLQSLPVPPSLHLAVVSSDMGAPGDATASIGCTTRGDQGEFQSAPRGTCVNTTLSAGATFISDAGMMPNYTDPLGSVVQCIALLGDEGCGFEHQLA